MSGKLYSLTTRCYTTLLKLVSTNYANHHNALVGTAKAQRMHAALTATPLIPFDDHRAVAFVHALLKANLSTYLAYAEPDTQNDILAKLMFGENVELTVFHTAFVNDFLTVDEIDDLYIDLDLQLSRILERDTWAIVDIIDMGKSLSIVVQEDMRIREWREMKGYSSGGFTPAMELDLSEMFTYLRIKTNQLLRPVTMEMPNGQKCTIQVGDHIEFRSIVLDLLVERFPNLRADNQIGPFTGKKSIGAARNGDLLVAAGLAPAGSFTADVNADQILSVEHFLDRLVEPVVTSHAVKRYVGTLDPLIIYTVAIENDNILRITRQEETTVKINPDVQIKELVESYLRGDWLPPKDREKAERWVQENQ
jgi:hypothetical protein